MDAAGNVFVSDEGNSTLRKISATNGITTIAGLTGIPGVGDGVGPEARFNLPGGVAIDSRGGVLLADYYNFTIRLVRFGVPLKTDIVGNKVILSWSSIANDVVPQARSSLLSGSVWTTLPGPVVTSANRCYATNSFGTGPAFFRLIKP